MEKTFNRRKALILADRLSNELLEFHRNLVRAGYDYPLLITDSVGYVSDEFTSMIDEFLIHNADTDQVYPVNLVGTHYDKYVIYTNENTAIQNDAGNPMIKVDTDIYNGNLIYVSSFAKHGHGKLITKDTYSAYGKLISRHTYDIDAAHLINSVYFDEYGHIILTKNGESGIYDLMVDGKHKLFTSVHEFVRWYLKEHGYSDYSVIMSTFGLSGMAVGELNNFDNMLLIPDKVKPDILQHITNITAGRLRNISDIIVRHSESISSICENVDLKGTRIHYLGDIESVKFGQSGLTSCLIFLSSFYIRTIFELAKSVPGMTFHAIVYQQDLSAIAEEALQYDNIVLHRADQGQSVGGLVRKLSNICGIAVNIYDTITGYCDLLLDKGCIVYKLGGADTNIDKCYYYAYMNDDNKSECLSIVAKSLQSILDDPSSAYRNYCAKRNYSLSSDYDRVLQQNELQVVHKDTTSSLLVGLNLTSSATAQTQFVSAEPKDEKQERQPVQTSSGKRANSKSSKRRKRK